MKKNDNRGLSLVELIICIAIISILVGMFISSMNYVGNSQARALANSIKTAVGQARIQTMGKYETFLYIYRNDSDKKYYKETWRKANEEGFVREKTELLGKNRPTVTYYVNGEPSGTSHTIEGNPSDGLLISFDRTNGKEISKSITGSSFKDSEGNNITLVTGNDKSMPSTSVSCNKIEVSYGTRVYEIEIIPETGKIILGK